MPDGLDAEHPLIGLLRDDADETAIAAGFERHRAAARGKRELRRRDLEPGRHRLVRRQAGRHDLRLGEADRGDQVRIEMPPRAGDDLGDHRALRRRLMRQHRLASEVADRPHIAHRGAALVVDFDERPRHVEAHLLEAPAFGQRPTPDRHEDLVGLDRDLFAVRSLDRELPLVIEPA